MLTRWFTLASSNSFNQLVDVLLTFRWGAFDVVVAVARRAVAGRAVVVDGDVVHLSQLLVNVWSVACGQMRINGWTVSSDKRRQIFRHFRCRFWITFIDWPKLKWWMKYCYEMSLQKKCWHSNKTFSLKMFSHWMFVNNFVEDSKLKMNWCRYESS